MVRTAWFSPLALLLVILGGAAGVAVRAAIIVPFGPSAHPLVVPALTLAINLVGALLLGVVVGLLDDRHPLLRLALGTGVMGGFTTYSAFAVQSLTVTSASPAIGLVLIAVSLFGGVVAAVIGLGLGRRIADRPGEIEPAEDAE